MKVIYERDPAIGNGYQAYRGRLEWSPASTEDFIGVHFEALLRLINKRLPIEDFELTFIRTDRPELQPYPLEQELVKCIKNDPEEAIKRMSHPDVRIVVGRRPEPPAPLRACGDNMAAAFGERVLVRRRPDRAECPGCGTWAPTLVVGQDRCRTKCDKCHTELTLEFCGDEWFFVKVEDLLELERDKFFLPREWNGFHPWVTKEKLRNLYEEFLAAKEQF
jgi:hypothetical protein